MASGSALQGNRQSKLGEKLAYILTGRTGCRLTDGRAEVDSNRIDKSPPSYRPQERALRRPRRSGTAWGRIATLIESCKNNGVPPSPI